LSVPDRQPQRSGLRPAARAALVPWRGRVAASYLAASEKVRAVSKLSELALTLADTGGDGFGWLPYGLLATSRSERRATHDRGWRGRPGRDMVPVPDGTGNAGVRPGLTGHLAEQLGELRRKGHRWMAQAARSRRPAHTTHGRDVFAARRGGACAALVRRFIYVAAADSVLPDRKVLTRRRAQTGVGNGRGTRQHLRLVRRAGAR
jgi:hypothetical protein